MIGVIIPTLKRDIKTLESLKDAPPHRLVVSQKLGLGKARNWGTSQLCAYGCRGSNLIVFLDDDLILSQDIWKLFVFSVKRGEFAMLSVKGRCSSRVVIIHCRDFWSIGGFDESIRYTAEDVDFFLRAEKSGLKYHPIPEYMAFHVEHERRGKDPLINIKIHFEQAKILVRHKQQYLDFWNGSLNYFIRWIKKPRTHFPTMIGFFYYLLRSFLS